MAAARPQPILTPLTPAAIFLVVTINDGAEAAARVHDAFGEILELAPAIGFRVPTSNLNVVIGIGSAAWDRLFDGPRPAKLHPFLSLDGGQHQAPSTPGDLLFHIRGESMDVCYEVGGRILAALSGAVAVVDEVHGFRFFEMRDLLGFVDGTENPDGPDAVATALIGPETDEDPALFGGSYVHVQRYTHDMTGWNALSVTEQELIIGRTKLDDIELDDAVKPANSHVALNTLNDEDGNELAIVRANMPFGTLGDGKSGTYYIAYAADPDVTEQMLTNMFIGDPPGNTDRILEFSTAETGGMFFVPSTDFLGDPPTLPGAGETAESFAPEELPGITSPYDGALEIGSLKGQRQ